MRAFRSKAKEEMKLARRASERRVEQKLFAAAFHRFAAERLKAEKSERGREPLSADEKKNVCYGGETLLKIEVKAGLRASAGNIQDNIEKCHICVGVCVRG